MFITNICTKYKHFECFDIRNNLFEMQEYFKDSKRIQCLSGRPMVHLQLKAESPLLFNNQNKASSVLENIINKLL